MDEPSVEAKYLSSLRTFSAATLPKTRLFFFTSSAAFCSRSSFSATSTANGSLLVRRIPAVAVRFHRTQLHRRRLNGRVRFRNDHRLACHPRNLFLRHQRRRGEAPRAVHNHPNAETRSLSFPKRSAPPASCRCRGRAKAAARSVDCASARFGYRSKSLDTSSLPPAPRRPAFRVSGDGLRESFGVENRSPAKAIAEVVVAINWRRVSIDISRKFSMTRNGRPATPNNILHLTSK